MKTLPQTPAYTAACYAALFAQEIGLPRGNMWEPAIARKIEADIRMTNNPKAVFETWQAALGLRGD